MIATKSLFRRAEYEALSCLTINGPVLDVGGSKKSGYHELIQGSPEFTVGNIDPSYGIDVQFDAEEAWPFNDAQFSGVLLVNVLEHLFRFDRALLEARRVLRPGGVVAGVVPFMFNVHASPCDFHRFTKFALERHLAEAGFSDVVVRELGTGAFSVIYHCLLGFIRWQWLASITIPFFRGMDRLLSRIKPGTLMGPTYYPLGYYFEARAL